MHILTWINIHAYVLRIPPPARRAGPRRLVPQTVCYVQAISDSIQAKSGGFPGWCPTQPVHLAYLLAKRAFVLV